MAVVCALVAGGGVTIPVRRGRLEVIPPDELTSLAVVLASPVGASLETGLDLRAELER
ncbi:hypothetical protein GS429_04805 [Natronorubrum sp. JWXQ-INN-674]|uniref:Uncharacterized protein n=1 Tax=Natronorubrum halalkaliphilum TaxID=2691917 RepID=A0A6B0VIP3_9EURY|nr:hypothetical protein [Natronorubrum halalkaliphilum]MXV61394.1 hypothetical protein [Natronorubrum halalkaliphilum]